jgi:transposase
VVVVGDQVAIDDIGEMPLQAPAGLLGVDTHGDLYVACALDQLGRRLATTWVATTPRGYRVLLAWARSFGEVAGWGVEGTGCYGAGLVRFLATQGQLVWEVNRPDRQARRQQGKSDPIDAEAAARAVQAGQATAIPKAGDHLVEMVRCLRVARASAAKARTQTANALRALVVTAPAELREQLRDLPAAQLASTAARLRPGPIATTTAATKLALRLLGERFQALDAELVRVDAELDRLTTKAAPGLRQLCGVGPEIAGALLVAAGDNPERLRSEAAFSMLCGASPIPASSGKTVRHRLNRGGNRQANTALYRIVVVRLRWHQPTRAYLARRTNEGLSKREIIRCLKRSVAREVFAASTPTAVAAPA